MTKELTWRKAVEKVLKESSTALHYLEIADAIRSKGYRVNLGATPAASVGSTLAIAIAQEGNRCPFTRIDRGNYIWKGTQESPGHGHAPDKIDSAEDAYSFEPQYSIITSFGMFWRRNAIEWSNNPRILGMQQPGATPVDFRCQLGLYLLYDGREVIYVGRVTDRGLGKRLYEHTIDRFSARWDRFSWFGMAPVSTSGELGVMPRSISPESLIPAIEAILIEALEPRQNRKRGDDLSAVEYMQREDPELEKKRALRVVAEAIKSDF